VAKGYRPVNRDQPFLLPPCMRDWLPPDHPVWLVIRVVEQHLDTSAFGAARRTGGAGAAGYDPDMLVTLLVWGYAHGVTSSRRMEQLCGTDVAFRVICGGNLPDHATIARFRAAFAGTAAGLFAEVLALCARLGMGKLGVVALDGTKIAASASKSANRGEDRLRKMAGDAVAAHAAADAAEDAMFGEAAGDEVPGDAWSPRWRDGRIAAALAGLEAERAEREAEAARRQAAAGQDLADAAAGRPRRGRPAAGTEVAAADLAARRIRAARQARSDDWAARDAAARAAGGRGLDRRTRPVPPGEHAGVRAAEARAGRARARAAAEKDKNREEPAPVRNVTDPDSRLMPVRGGGFIQGYNAQNAVSQDGLILATELTADQNDAPWFEPMLRQAEDAARLIAARQPPLPRGAGPGPPGGREHLIGLFLADAGYLSEDNLACSGPDRLIATGKRRDLEKTARQAAEAGRGQDLPAGGSEAIAAMAERLRTQDGITACRQRGHIAETPHGHIKHNMGFRQLSLRGKSRAAAEWAFACAVQNLFKAITSGHLTTATLNALARPAGHPPSPLPAPA